MLPLLYFSMLGHLGACFKVPGTIGDSAEDKGTARTREPSPGEDARLRGIWAVHTYFHWRSSGTGRQFFWVGIRIRLF